jgi:surface antigen
MYVDDNISPIELLAGSNNLSEYMDKQEYRASVRDELTSTIAQVKKLKAELSQQKIDVEKVLADQKTQKEALVAKQGEQQRILNDTQGQEAAYQNMIGANQSKIAEARAIQAAINSRYTGSGGYLLIDSGSLGDYPWDDSNCPMWGYLSTGGADGNGGDGHGYGCRQCASYVAWRFAKETGIYPSWGNAVNFTANAKSLGYPEGDAQAGSIAVMDAAKAGQGYGHVAWVETDPYVNNRGQTVIQVSQYNYDFGWGFGYYSRMELSVNAFDHYIHIK